MLSKRPVLRIACLLFACGLLPFAIGASRAYSQTPTPTPESEEMKTLRETLEKKEMERKIAEADKAIAEANKAKESAEQPPKASATPLEGKTELDAGVKIETEMMAYRALGKAAEKVAQEVDGKTQGKRIAILNNQWLNGLRGYWAAFGQMRLMGDGYKKILYQPQRRTLLGAIEQPAARDTAAVLNGRRGVETAKMEDFFKSREQTGGIQSVTKSSDNAEVNSSSPDANGFSAEISRITSNFGAVGSLVGAAVDLMALLRTDTKISGLSYTVPESAFVSAVYRGLKVRSGGTTLYYPGEFPPNVNLRRNYYILEEIAAVGDWKTAAEGLVLEIEEIEKAHKEGLAAKAQLEARQKQLPDEIAATRSKLTALETAFPLKNRRPREVVSDIEELGARLAMLKKEADALPKKIESNAEALRELAARLAALSARIRPIAPPEELINGFLRVGSELYRKSRATLGRSYTFEEIEVIAEPTEMSKARLAAAWKKELGTRYLKETVDALLDPYDRARLKIFVKIARHLRETGGLIEQLDPGAYLTDEEQLMLLYKNDAQVKAEKNIRDKNIGAQVTRLKALNKQFDKFFEDSTKVDSATGFSPFAAYLQSENLMTALDCNFQTGKCDNAYALVLGVIDVGGNNRTKKNLLTMVATGANVAHSGGAIVTYKLYDMNGDVKTSSICRAYEPYTSAKKINRRSRDQRDQAVCELEEVGSVSPAERLDPEGERKAGTRQPPRIKNP